MYPVIRNSLSQLHRLIDADERLLDRPLDSEGRNAFLVACESGQL